jgi:hypothetical protein
VHKGLLHTSTGVLPVQCRSGADYPQAALASLRRCGALAPSPSPTGLPVGVSYGGRLVAQNSYRPVSPHSTWQKDYLCTEMRFGVSPKALHLNPAS